MPIKEESFRIGCGRYIQGNGYISRLYEEVSRLGTSPLIIGGKTAISLTRDKIEDCLNGNCNKYEIIIHTSTCNKEDSVVLAQLCRDKGYDVIVGVGGGVICDFAKLTAIEASLPVITVPTSSATCACCTPLSVCYTKEGRTVGTSHFKTEVNCVIADTEILLCQPERLFLAGVFDALAKFVEIGHRFTPETKEYPLGLDYAYYMSKRSFDVLSSKTQKCLDDMKNGELTFDLENVLFTSLAATGVISGVARGSNQTALAHKFYESVRLVFPAESRPYLHGEIVGIGLLLQNHYNGFEENNGQILDLMKKYNMPSCAAEAGVPQTEENYEILCEKIIASSAIDEKNPEECRKLRESMKYLWSLGK